MLNAGWMKIHRWYVPTSWCAWCSLAKRCARHSQLLTETVMTPPMMVTECENVNDPVRRGCGETWFCRWLFSSQHRDISAKHRLMTIINTINPANSLRIGRTCFCAENSICRLPYVDELCMSSNPTTMSKHNIACFSVLEFAFSHLQPK